MLSEIGIAPSVLMQFQVDYQVTISQIASKASLLKAKHVDAHLKAHHGVIATCHLRSKQMLVNLLTKAIDAKRLAALRGLMRLR